MTSYDAIPYTSYPYERTHPDRLATVGGLFGMNPTPPSRARVLELGCASGGNLLPMAEQLPDAELVGVDLSQRQIDVGRAAIEEAGLTNVQLRVGDLTEVDESWGEFDYIICHGVMSWVSDTVRERLIGVFASRLTPHGLGLVSYNTFPGWHLRQAVREMMLYHVEQFDDPMKQAEQAKALLDFVVEHGPSAQQGGNAGFSAVLQREAELLRRLPDDYLFHEHLEEHNTPLYFHVFEASLRANGLAYVGDADVATMMTEPLGAEAAEQLQAISPDLVRLEQYLDFVRGRQFRSTIMCRGDVPLSRNLGGDRVVPRYLGFAGGVRPDQDPVDLSAGVPHDFTAGTTKVRSDVPVTKAALDELRRRAPAFVPFGVLLAEAQQVLRLAGIDTGPGDEGTLSADLLRCYLGGGIKLRTEPPRFVRDASPRPRASAYARWQARNFGYVTNSLHARVELDRAARAVVQMLDGQRDRGALIAGLVECVADGRLSLSRDDEPLTDPAEWAAPLAVVLDHTLRALADGALLMA